MKNDILGVKISNITKKEALQKCWQFLNCGNHHVITTPNPEMVVMAQKDDYFRKIFEHADLCLPDGFGLILASRLFGAPLKERITGTDFVSKLCGLAEYGKCSVFLLGAKKGVAKKASEKLKAKYPNLSIVGAESGGLINKMSLEEKYDMLIRINRAKPDILFVAFGHGRQEKWIAENISKMPSIKIAMGIGGAFDFIAGEVKRAPAIFQRAGLEWLWRLIKEPRRYKRIYNATIKFGLLCILHKTRN
ncbi:MAG: WecB/TagA/CpsF family glycosyltransferase [Parcubacteria group bacterium]|nr:WecB/TagA/CpsF family glycosyltransferase [Parcubacteria group bacterium]